MREISPAYKSGEYGVVLKTILVLAMAQLHAVHRVPSGFHVSFLAMSNNRSLNVLQIAASHLFPRFWKVGYLRLDPWVRRIGFGEHATHPSAHQVSFCNRVSVDCGSKLFTVTTNNDHSMASGCPH